MSFSTPIRRLILAWALTATLDVVVLMLGWTQAAVGLTALAIGVPLGCLMHYLREVVARYGASEWEFGPVRAAHLPAATYPGDQRPCMAPRVAASRWLPDAVEAAQRVGVLFLLATTVMTLRTAMALQMFPH